MRTSIIVNLQIEAIHSWPLAKEILPQMAFLSDPHRHMFWITAEKVVEHNERDIEIIQFKREIENYFKRNYFSETLNMCDFGGRSCETLCHDLMGAYDLESCRILEDGENGSHVIK